MKYCCIDMGENVHSLVLKPDLEHSLFYFCTFEVIFSQSKVSLPRYGRTLSLAGIETGFKALAVRSELLCLDTGENVHFPVL